MQIRKKVNVKAQVTIFNLFIWCSNSSKYRGEADRAEAKSPKKFRGFAKFANCVCIELGVK